MAIIAAILRQIADVSANQRHFYNRGVILEIRMDFKVRMLVLFPRSCVSIGLLYSFLELFIYYLKLLSGYVGLA